MIREFFTPRTFFLFLFIWVGLTVLWSVWYAAMGKDDRKIVRHYLKIPVFSGLAAAALVGVLIFIVSLLP